MQAVDVEESLKKAMDEVPTKSFWDYWALFVKKLDELIDALKAGDIHNAEQAALVGAKAAFDYLAERIDFPGVGKVTEAALEQMVWRIIESGIKYAF